MADVFVSYAHQDRNRIEQIVEYLKRIGLSVWHDKSLASGSSFNREISKELGEAKAVLVCWSKHAVSSEYVESEAHEARNKKKFAPCRLEECEIPFPFNSHHAVDIIDWQGDWAHKGWQQLIERIGELVVRPGLVGRLGAPALSEALADRSKGKLEAWAGNFPDDPYAQGVKWEIEQREVFAAERERAEKLVREPFQKRAKEARLAFLELAQTFDAWLAQGPNARQANRPDPAKLAAKLVAGIPDESWGEPPAKPTTPSRKLLIGIGLLAFAVGATVAVAIDRSTAPEKSTADLQAKTEALAQQVAAAHDENLALRKRLNESDASAAAAKSSAADELQRLRARTESLEDENGSLQGAKSHGSDLEIELQAERSRRDAAEAQARQLQGNLDSRTRALNDALAQLSDRQSPPPEPVAPRPPPVAPRPPKPAASTAAFQTFRNRSIQGNDVKRYDNLAGVTQCTRKCEQTDGCRAYTFNKWAKLCFLKSAAGPLLLNPRTDTGLAAPAAPELADKWTIQLHRGKGFPGNGFETFAASFDACERRCRAETRCVAFNHMSSGNTCKLFEETSNEYYPMDGTDSGLKMQDAN